MRGEPRGDRSRSEALDGGSRSGAQGGSPRVLVTGVGGPAGVAVMQSLAVASMELFAADIDPYAVGLYLVEAPRRALLPPGDREDFPGFLLELCERERIDALVPTVDCELLGLALRREEFELAGTQLVLASAQTLRVCLDKWVLHERCLGSVPIPATALLDEAFNPAAQELPVIVKPRVGSGSRGVRTVARASAFAELPRDGSLLVQELLPGIEYSLDVLADRAGHVQAVVPRSRLKVDSGIAVAGRTLHDGTLQDIGARVAQRIGLTGVANVQVKDDAGGEPALLEVNPRFPGTMPLTVAAGIDMPRICVQEALGAEPPVVPLQFEDLAMVRHMHERFMAPAELAALEAIA